MTGNAGFAFIDDFEINIPIVAGVELQTGAQFWANQLWASFSGGSVTNLCHGLVVDSGYVGFINLVGATIQGLPGHGVWLQGDTCGMVRGAGPTGGPGQGGLPAVTPGRRPGSPLLLAVIMGAVSAAVSLLVAVTLIVVIIRRFRFNAKGGGAGAYQPVDPRAYPPVDPPVDPPAYAPVDPRANPPAYPHVNALRSASPPWPPGALRYSEDGIYSLGRPVGIGAGVFAFATLTLVALLVTCEAQTTWLPVVVMFFSGTFVVGTLILGLFYTSGLPDAMYIRIRNDRTVPIPLVMTATGMGSTTTFNTTWSGPEFLIGTKRPQELQHAVRNAVSAYRFTGGHPIWVALGEPRQPEAL